MNPDWFVLRPLRAPRLDHRHLNNAVEALAELTEGINPAGPAPSADRVEALRKRLRRGYAAGHSFDVSTDVPRRANLLLWLYLEDLASDSTRQRIPPISEAVAASILGPAGKLIRADLRRLATQLYFTHFDPVRIPCLSWLASRLSHAWHDADPERLDAAGLAWSTNAVSIFGQDAPDSVANHWHKGMTVTQLAQAWHIPEDGLFHRRLFESVILKRLRELPMSESDADLNELVIAEKAKIVWSGRELGAAAVEILINRSIAENNSLVPKDWAQLLVAYACDPRIPSQAERHRWWGWATSVQRDVAIRALSWMSLEEFIRLLEKSLVGTPQGYQFHDRRNLLEKLFKKGIVIEARLVIPQHMRGAVDKKTLETIQPSWLGGNQNTSFVCLRCIDNVFLIEGTHSFSLRGFVGADAFPIRRYWDSSPRVYGDTDFRVHETRCPIYQRHMGYRWVESFLDKLRQRRIEWNLD